MPRTRRPRVAPSLLSRRRIRQQVRHRRSSLRYRRVPLRLSTCLMRTAWTFPVQRDGAGFDQAEARLRAAPTAVLNAGRAMLAIDRCVYCYRGPWLLYLRSPSQVIYLSWTITVTMRIPYASWSKSAANGRLRQRTELPTQSRKPRSVALTRYFWTSKCRRTTDSRQLTRSNRRFPMICRKSWQSAETPIWWTPPQMTGVCWERR